MRRALVILGLAMLGLLGLRALVLEIPWAWPREAYFGAAETVPFAAKILFWVVAMLIPVYLTFDWIFGRRRRQDLVLQGRDGGPVVLKQRVVTKIVRQSVEELPEIASLTVLAKSRAKGLRVDLGVKARSVRSVRELDAAIRSRVDESLRRILGIERIDSIVVRLDDMSAYEHSSPRGAAPAPVPPPRAPIEDRVSAPAGPVASDTVVEIESEPEFKLEPEPKVEIEGAESTTPHDEKQ